MIGSTDTARDPLLAISNGMVRVFKDVVGRGPRRARASFAGSDALVVVLEHTLTTVERSLVQMGDHRRLHELRLFVQSALEPRAREIVEEALNRRTVAFATGIDARQDVAVVFFALGARIDADEASLGPSLRDAAQFDGGGG